MRMTKGSSWTQEMYVPCLFIYLIVLPQHRVSTIIITHLSLCQSIHVSWNYCINIHRATVTFVPLSIYHLYFRYLIFLCMYVLYTMNRCASKPLYRKCKVVCCIPQNVGEMHRYATSGKRTFLVGPSIATICTKHVFLCAIGVVYTVCQSTRLLFQFFFSVTVVRRLKVERKVHYVWYWQRYSKRIH